MVWKVFILPVALLLVTSIHGVHSQSCGIVGSPPTTIIIEGIPDILPTYTKIWETELFNVTRTSASIHPHSKYIEGIKVPNSVKYYFRTSPVFQNFIADQSSTVITRKNTFHCLGGGTVTQNFEIRLNVTDKEEPKFLETAYVLEITKDWPVYDDTDATKKAINQATMIIAGDADTQFVNADLKFSSSLKNLEDKNVIEVIGTKLWPEGPDGPSGNFYYRVDLYLKETLNVGEYEFFVFASSRHRSGSTQITLNVK